MPYQVEELVGGGLYADVYRATGPNGTVALKVARTSSRAESAQTLAWFAAEAVNFHTGSTGPAFLSAEGMNNLIAVEAEQLRKLRHPAFVRLLDSGMAWHGADARRYLVTEWIQGRTWRQMLELGERIPLLAVLDVVLALVWAEQFEKQLWHGDIKPENLLFDESGRLHIIDPSAGATCFDKTGTPTQILLTNWYNPWLDASDIPAIGVLLMEVATGSQPLLFASRTPSERPIGEESASR